MDNQVENPRPKSTFKDLVKANFISNFSALIGALVITGVFVCGYTTYLVWNNFNEAKRIAEEGQKQSQELQALRQAQAEQKRANPIANWQTYRNEKYGFEFKYPKDFEEMFRFEDKFFVRNDTIVSFGVYLEQSILGAEGIRPVPISATKTYTIDDQKVFAYFQEDTLEGLVDSKRYIMVNIDKYNQPLWIIATFPIKNPELEKLIDQMFSTFRFIKSDPTASWKTFIDSKGRFEIKYPEDFYMDYSEQYPAGEYRVFGVNDVSGASPHMYFSLYAKPERTITEEAACREAGGGYIRKYYMNEKIEIDGQTHIKCYYDRELQKDQALFISFNRDGYRWEFLATHFGKYKEIIDQILSTFRFTK